MIPFNKPLYLGNELEYITQAITNNKLSGDGLFTLKCNNKLEEISGSKKVLLTTSCTHAIELAALLLDIKEGDEVIMPSYTFVSTANPFSLRGAKIIFVDIRPDTMNIDEELIEAAISSRTKAIVVVHYAGVGCEMDFIMKLSEKYNIKVIEDAAQGFMATYKGRMLGSIGHFGAYSFHDTKNYTSGEGGALLINDENYFEKAEVIREKGTNRSKFLRGEVDKYSWVDIGSSYLPSELNAAYLYPQLLECEKVNKKRLFAWNLYYERLKDTCFDLPFIPSECKHNAHMFYVKFENIDERQSVIDYLKKHDIQSVFHYIPLHSSFFGKKAGFFNGRDIFTTAESEKLLRLPMYYSLNEDEINLICSLLMLWEKEHKCLK